MAIADPAPAATDIDSTDSGEADPAERGRT
jgi:hypothetical protein